MTVRVEPSRSATQACVVVAIPFRVNHWVLQALRTGSASALLDAALFDQSVLAFVAYEAAEDKLCGSTVDAVKNKVVGSACGAQGDEFLISVTCAPTLASARKCAGIVLQSLRWGSLYQRYMNWCRVLRVRADKAAYSHAASAANRATGGGVAVVITGKVHADDAGTARSADFLSRMIKDARPKEEGRPRMITLDDVERAGEGHALAALYTSYPAPSLFGIIARNFVESNLHGEQSQLVSGALYIPKSKDSLAERLSRTRKADKYAASLLRLGSEARAALVFTAAKGCYVGSASLTINGPPVLTEASAAAAIKNAFARQH